MKINRYPRLLAWSCITLVSACVTPCSFAQTGSAKINSSSDEVALPILKTLTSKKGRKLEAMILSSTGTSILVKRKSDGKVFELPLRNLSDDDKAFVKNLPKSAPTGRLFIDVPDRATQLAQIEEDTEAFLKVSKSDYFKKHLPLDVSNAKNSKPSGLGALSKRLRHIDSFPNQQESAFDLARLAVVEKEEKALISLFNIYKIPESIPAKFVDDCYAFTKYHAEQGNPHAMFALGNVASKGHNRPTGGYKNQTEEEAHREGMSWVKKAMPLFKENNDQSSYKAAQHFLKYEETTLVAIHKGTPVKLLSYGPRNAEKVLIFHNSNCSGSYCGSSGLNNKTLGLFEPLFKSGWGAIAVIHPEEGELADEMRKVDEIRWEDQASRKTVKSNGFGEAIFKTIKMNRKFKQYSFLGHGYGAGMMLWDIEMIPQNQIHSLIMIRPTPAALPSLKNLKMLKKVYLTDPSQFYNDDKFYEKEHNHPGIRKWYKEQMSLYDIGIKTDGSSFDWEGLVRFLGSQQK